MKNRTCFLLLFPFLFVPSLFSQTSTSGDIFDHVSSLISGMPGNSGNDYAEPTPAQMTDWDLLLDDLFSANYSDADTKADALGYGLLEFSDTPTGETFYVLETQGTNYWGTYILNPNACRSELVMMAPHPKKDFNTGKQAIYCFQELDAYFFMMSGTNRCNHSDASSCSGSTSVCSGSSESYRISDMAHVTDAIWQKTTEYVHDNVAGTYFVQLHGFTKQPTDPYVIMSNGTRETPAPDYIVDLRDELLVVDPVLTFKIGHIDLSWNRLLGFTNTNGRYINSSGNPCSTSAVNTNGRFLHVEQEKTRLRDDINGWNKMGAALGEAFNSGGCPSLALLPVELAFFEVKNWGGVAHLSWETISETDFDYFAIEHSINGVFHEIDRVEANGSPSKGQAYSFEDSPGMGWHFYRLRQMDMDGRATFSPVKTIYIGSVDLNFEKNYFEGQIWKVTFPKEVSARLVLSDQLGREVASTDINGKSAQMDTDQLPGGVYFYHIKMENGNVLSGKLWKPKG